MIYINDIQRIMDKWTERINNPTQSFAYKNGIGECIYDLNSLINKSIEEELSYQDALAVEHFSNLEPEEFYNEAV